MVSQTPQSPLLIHDCTQMEQAPGLGTEEWPIMIDSDVSDDEDDLPVASAAAPAFTNAKPYDQTIKEPRLLLGLPTELLKMIADHPDLSPIDRYSLALTTRILHSTITSTTKKPKTPLSKEDYLLFNARLEASQPSPRHPIALSLLCSICLAFRPCSSFPDAQSKRAMGSRARRTCLQCCIAKGRFNRACFRLGGLLHFVCEGCSQALPVATMMMKMHSRSQPVVSRRGRQSKSERAKEMKVKKRISAYRAVELRLKVGDRRWCRPCWRGVCGFWRYVRAAGKMRDLSHTDVAAPYSSSEENEEEEEREG